MALIKCEECGKEFSDKAKFCPHCGIPKAKRKLTFEEKGKNAEEKRRRAEQKELERIANLPEEERKIAQEQFDNQKAKSTMFQVLFWGILIILIIAVLRSCSGDETKQVSKQVDPIETHFSAGGEHYELARMVKESMHNPDSYEFVSGEHWTNSNGNFASLKYRGTNAFGGIVTEEVVATLDENGNIVSISR
ncbi:MAG: zinc ribbon domain-containing protein [Sulfuricurvum sp.]|nr:zinc ribbon domain-containing protein [Sulfuricurvum sp.]